jgi:cytosine/adenosine deaminase-related metal-dependent hydrolase
MRKTTVILGIMLSIAYLSCTKTETADLAITNVTIIDVTGAPPQSDMTVLIADNRILKIRKAQKIKMAADAQVIDGSGKFLIPGLWDMHVHLGDKNDLALFIANGVTSVRLMLGFPENFKWREEISAGELIGPRMIIASQVADGPEPGRDIPFDIHNEAEGREFVRKYKNEGADFIKVLSHLSRDSYFAIVDEARKQGIPVAGHVPYSVSAAEVSDAGQRSIEHTYGVLIPCSSKEDELGKKLMKLVHTYPARIKLYADVDYNEQIAADLFARFVKNNTFVCPTLIAMSELVFRDEKDLANDPRLKFVSSDKLEMWDWFGREIEEVRTELKKLCQKGLDIVGEMKRAGVELLPGTDSAPYCFHGFSLHNELELFIQAGLSPMQALRTATYNPAKFFGKLDSMGTIEQGKVADLVLLEANPLVDVRNTQKIAAVVVGGKILKKAALQEMLAQVEAAVKKNKEK